VKRVLFPLLVCLALAAGVSSRTTTVDAATAVASAAPIAPAAAVDSSFVPLTPARIADTRSGLGGVQGPVASDSTTDFIVVGVGAVPAEATSVVLNVTVVSPTATGYLTVFPAGSPRPDSSNLNFVAGANVPNLVIARVGVGGKISVYNFGGQAHVLLDATGYFVSGSAAGRFYTFPPFRTFDTRINKRTDGTIVPVPPRGLLHIGLFPRVGSHLTAILLNVTATNPTSDGFITVYPTGDIFPTTSNLNFKAGQTVANAVIVKLGVFPNTDFNTLLFYNSAGFTDIIVDVLGVFDDGSEPIGFTGTPLLFRPLDAPSRVYDSRGSTGFTAGEMRVVNVTQAGGAAAGAWVALLNVTATRTTAPSYLTIWPSSIPKPTVSSLNWTAGDTVANFVGVAVPASGAAQGKLSFYNNDGGADVVVDATGYFYPVT